MKTNQLIYAAIKTSKVTGNLGKLIRTSKEIEKKQLKFKATELVSEATKGGGECEGGIPPDSVQLFLI